MLFLILLTAEVILSLAILVLLSLFLPSPLWAILFGLIAILLIYFCRPALHYSRKHQEKRRRILRRHPIAKIKMTVLDAPSHMKPAALSRLLEAGGIHKPHQAKTTAVLATLLDFNCRGLVEIRMSEEVEPMISIVSQTKESSLEKYEIKLLHILQHAMAPATSVRLSVFVEYAARHCPAMQRSLDGVFRAVDQALAKDGYLETVFLRKKKGLGQYLPKRRVALTEKAMTELGFWCAYLGVLCDVPALDSYPEDIDRFEKELQDAFLYAAAAGVFDIARVRILREFLFAPQSIWSENQYLSRVAYDNTGVMDLLWNVFYKIVCYGTKYYHADAWEEDLIEAKDLQSE